MLATAWPKAFDGDDWSFEVKWDGYRSLVGSVGGATVLRSRNGLDLSGRFPGVTELEFPDGWVIDGEVVVFGDDGIPDFSLLQTGAGAATLVAFDVLVADGQTIVDQAIETRREFLAAAPLPDAVVRSDPVVGDGLALFGVVEARGMEGIVGKRAGSIYQPGRRSSDWRKISVRRQLRAVVGGWTPGDGGRAASFGSLLVGLHDGDDFRWIGAVGSGFTDEQLSPITAALVSLERPTPPFVNTGAIPKGARWVDPGIVAVVEFKEWTRDLRLRAPVFKGLEVTPPELVTWETEGPEGTVLPFA